MRNLIKIAHFPHLTLSSLLFWILSLLSEIIEHGVQVECVRPVHRSSADGSRSNAGGVLVDNAKARATGLLDAPS